jgi:23S rRNA (adenine2030-N6)-methyltransferase
MNYRHIYHAGNIGDVLKHVVLIELVLALQAKEKGFCYIDTHSGIADYNLQSTEAQKTLEYTEGIAALFKTDSIPESLHTYTNLIKKLNVERGSHDLLEYYPGSPRFVQALARPQDRLILNELHPDDLILLKKAVYKDKRIAVHNRDAYEFLQGMLPPAEKRGLILIDPAYEKTDELEKMQEALINAMQRFPTGVYAIWLPIKEKHYRDFYRNLKRVINAEILIAEVVLKDLPQTAESLIGSSMIIINPPYQIEKKLREQMKALWELWSPDKTGHYSVLKDA